MYAFFLEFITVITVIHIRTPHWFGFPDLASASLPTALFPRPASNRLGGSLLATAGGVSCLRL